MHVTHIRCYHSDVLCLHSKIRVTQLMMMYVSVEQYNYDFVVIPQYFLTPSNFMNTVIPQKAQIL